MMMITQMQVDGKVLCRIPGNRKSNTRMKGAVFTHVPVPIRVDLVRQQYQTNTHNVFNLSYELSHSCCKILVLYRDFYVYKIL